MSSDEQRLSDIDETVTLHVAGDGSVSVELSAAAFRRPPGELARRIVETAERLPKPGADADAVVESGIESLGQIQQAAATGGYEAMAELMRRRLGIESPGNTLDRDPEYDRAVAGHLDGVLQAMRSAREARREPPPEVEVLTAEACTEEGDVRVTSTSERAIADVWLGPEARKRGIDELGQTLTTLIAKARAKLRERSGEKLRDTLPAGLADTVANAPADAERAGRTGAGIVDQVVQSVDSIKRKAGRE